MDRILALPHVSLDVPVTTFARKLHETWCAHADTKLLATLPRDRLDDMGIAPRTEANQRHSGEAGKVPTMPLW